jgi:hypothetical protein
VVVAGGDLLGAGRRVVLTTGRRTDRRQVTEHRMVSRRCGCRTVTTTTAGVSVPVHYRPRIAALCAYLWSVKRTLPLTADATLGL